MAWQDDAACGWNRSDPRPEFFAAPGTLAERRALRYCARCPVIAECLQEALQTETVRFCLDENQTITFSNDLDGVVGGTNKPDRVSTRHYDGCTKRNHRACRPIAERITLLLASFYDHARATGLTDKESAA